VPPLTPTTRLSPHKPPFCDGHHIAAGGDLPGSTQRGATCPASKPEEIAMSKVTTTLATVAFLAAVLAAGSASAGTHVNGPYINGANLNGTHINGWRLNGWRTNGLSRNGWRTNGLSSNGTSLGGQATHQAAQDETPALRVIGIELPQ